MRPVGLLDREYPRRRGGSTPRIVRELLGLSGSCVPGWAGCASDPISRNCEPQVHAWYRRGHFRARLTTQGRSIGGLIPSPAQLGPFFHRAFSQRDGPGFRLRSTPLSWPKHLHPVVPRQAARPALEAPGVPKAGPLQAASGCGRRFPRVLSIHTLRSTTEGIPPDYPNDP